jgi:hypothetical protein
MTFSEEIQSALRGWWAVLRNDRSAPDQFDLSLRGFVTSLIPVVALMVFVQPLNLGETAEGVLIVPAYALVILQAYLYAARVIGVYAFLRLVKRERALVPLLTVWNWNDVIVTAAALILTLVGLNGMFFIVVVYSVLLFYFVRSSQMIAGLDVPMILGMGIAMFAAMMIAMMPFAPFIAEHMAALGNMQTQ